MYGIAVWQATMNYCEPMKDKVLRVAVPTKRAALVVNRAKVGYKSVRPLVREMWLTQARNDFIIKADVQQHCKAQVLYCDYLVFKELKVPK